MAALRRAARAIAPPVLLPVLLAALLAASALLPEPVAAQDDAPVRATSGRFTFLSHEGDAALARALLGAALARDTFPGLPRPVQAVVVAVAPDARRFRQWIGPGAPEWGAAIAFPQARRIIMQGRRSGSDAGDPFEVLRHELAHLALHEHMGTLPPRWFDEGYAAFAAGEQAREDFLATNLALVVGGVPTLDDLDSWFYAGPRQATAAYALGYRAVRDLAELDPRRGLTLFFGEWRQRRTLDGAVRAAFGTTQAGFERRWVRGIRLRYGMLALFADASVAAILMLALILPLFVMRRRRDRRRMAALLAADAAAEDAARASMLEELLGEAPPRPATDVPGST